MKSLLEYELLEDERHNGWTCGTCWRNRLIGIGLGLVVIAVFFGPALWVMMNGGGR